MKDVSEERVNKIKMLIEEKGMASAEYMGKIRRGSIAMDLLLQWIFSELC